MKNDEFLREVEAIFGCALSQNASHRFVDLAERYAQANMPPTKIVYKEKTIYVEVEVETKFYVTMQEVIHTVCHTLGVSMENMLSKKRKTEIVVARYLCMYYSRKYTGETFVAIGHEFKRDHTTVIHAIQKIKGFVEVRDELVISAMEATEPLILQLINQRKIQEENENATIDLYPIPLAESGPAVRCAN